MERGYRYTAVILKPNEDPVAFRTDSRVVRGWNLIPMSAARHDREWLKRSGFKMISDIFDHEPIVLSRIDRNKSNPPPDTYDQAIDPAKQE